MTRKLNVAVIGYGYWGPNLARNVELSEEFELVCICDFSEATLKKASTNHANVKLVTSIEDALKLEHLDAIIIATPRFISFCTRNEGTPKKINMFLLKSL